MSSTKCPHPQPLILLLKRQLQSVWEHQSYCTTLPSFVAENCDYGLGEQATIFFFSTDICCCEKNIIPNIKGQGFLNNKNVEVSERKSERKGKAGSLDKERERADRDRLKSKFEAQLLFKLMSPHARCCSQNWEEYNEPKRWLVSSTQLYALGMIGSKMMSKEAPVCCSKLEIWKEIYYARRSGFQCDTNSNI